MARRLFWIAAMLGVAHAAFSLYWAIGGTWLLATVGQWAVRLGRDEPGLAALTLALVAAVKLAAALIPLLVDLGRIGAPRFWRAVSWVGATGLVIYGLFNVVVATAVLTGVIPVADYDHAAMLGHAALWDPLFAAWGLALLGALAASRPGARGVRE
ncbi:DUF3995 domain-containing protein [Microbacteriaceae bacterium VKM Ac-2854]|nr:DUF3995 domain-containing protein [Microbacteriaceae bacterium VKM Ac-2854]